jgi:anti-sigma B factor antagonist
MSLNIERSYDDSLQSWIVSLNGDVDIQTSTELKDELNQSLDEKLANIVIDCEALTYIDSTGLGVLIGMLKRAKGNNLNISIQNAHPNVIKLLNITGLDKIFNII